MNPTPLPRYRRSSPLLLLVLATFANTALGQITEVGGIARSFQITNRTTRQQIRLADFAGQVLVLDFFAYWCGPCRVSSPDLETNVKDWFAARGGNANGVPVAVVPVNVESANESATDSFIRGAGLDLVANDYSASAYNQFETGFIPLFVIINGVPDSPSHRQWEVLYRDSGYPGAEAVRAVINRVKPSDPLSPPRVVVAPAPRVVSLGESFRLDVAATGAGPFSYQWHRNGQPIPAATADSWSQSAAQFDHSGRYYVRVSNANGRVNSTPVDVRVIQTGPATRYTSSEVPRAIPDSPAAGIASTLTVPTVGAVGRARLSLRIDHPYAGDLRATLRAPDGTTTVVFNRDTGVAEGVRLADLIVPETTSHPANGVWTLSVADLEAEDVGSLVSWSLSVELQTDPAAITFETWIATFPELKPEDRRADADPDGDQLPNRLEFLLNGRSPVVAEPLPGWYPYGSDRLEHVLRWRDGIPHRGASIWWTDDLVHTAWQPIQAGVPFGFEVIANQNFQTLVTGPRDQSRFFLQVRYDPSAD